MKQLPRVLALLCLLILSFVKDTYAGETETIYLATGEWRPYTSENCKHYGVASRIVTEAFALVGIKAKYEWFSWKRAYSKVKQGEIDGSLAWIKNPEREKDVYFSDPIFEGSLVFFHLKSYSFDWDTMEDLKGIKIGGTIGYNYGEKFQNAEKAGEILVDRAPKDKLNFRKLIKGRIKLFPISIDAGYAEIEANSKSHFHLFTHHPKSIDKKRQYRLILSKKIKGNKRIINIFNRGLKRLRESGKYDQFFAESQRGEYLIKQ